MFFEERKYIELIDDIGAFIEYWGFRKIHGRVWASVYLAEKPLSTPEIVAGLGVSKALVSGAINELLEHGLIVQVGQVKYGGHTYQACSNPAEVVRDVVKNRELVLFEKIENNLMNISKSKISDFKKSGVDPTAVDHLKTLTCYHKKLAHKFSRKKIKSMSDWISFMRKLSRFTL
ncbi:MAG: hypothetical protein CME62_06225 [Halobacteriovoraceae bacterium]|nr:hypothetical protein [Halobacteriovoraceae bacterium]|tara:strand:- start:6232 stop:6756 length:525 start_codon:yes stop_codon:yes gene_type:complete